MQNLEYFNQLKAALLKQYKEEHPHFQGTLSDFKGREIANFQEMLVDKVQGRISEKWFYTHLKVDHNRKLPRQDMLDLLARFTGHLHWDDFKKGQQEIVGSEAQTASKAVPEQMTEKPTSGLPAKWYVLIAVFLGLGFTLIKMMPGNQPFHTDFCFINDFSLEKIKANELTVYWLKEGETPQELQLNSNGCVKVSVATNSIELRIEGPYFQNQTINRTINTNHEEIIRVQPDEYSTLLGYFAKADVAAWKEKRARLETMFASNAMILQLAPDGKTGMELYNKEEFINQLTMPLKTMKNIKIVDQKRNAEHQITSLKFMLK